MKRILFLLSVCLMPCLHGFAQQEDWQWAYEMLTEEVAADDSEEEEYLELLFEQLSQMADNPVNINTLTREELEQMHFFNDLQMDAVLGYVSRYGPVRSKAELMMIDRLDDARRSILSAMTYVGEPPEREANLLDTLWREKNRYLASQKRYKGELTAYVKLPFYERKGDNSAYEGDKYKHWLRMNYEVSRHVKIGVLGAQDAGEPWFSGKNAWGYDFYSGYVQLQKLGALKNMVIGHYRIRTGLGLVLNNNISFGKTFGTATLYSPAQVIRPHSSRSESNYLQGAAATLGVARNWEATFFASCRPIDATMNDSTSIRTILKTGYHRTTSELDRKRNAWQTSAGAYLRYAEKRFHVGLTALYNHYNYPLKPWKTGSSTAQLYRYYYPTGQGFWNASVDYGYKLGRVLTFEGETGADGGGKVATVNTLSWQVARRLQLTAIQRFYPYKFCSTMGNSFSEGGTNQNESGIYVGAYWTPNARLSLTGYADIAYFAWPKYLATGSSHSFDFHLQAEYKVWTHTKVTARYRLKMREKNSDTDGVLIYKNDHRFRLSLSNRSVRWAWKSQADVSYCKYKAESFGWMISQSAKYSGKSWKIAASAAFFHTDDYNSRVYVYEQSTPYSLSFPSFYGEGIRLYVLSEASLLKPLSLIGKLGFSHYFDRDEIGSSYQTIHSSSQTDLELMLRWRF